MPENLGNKEYSSLDGAEFLVKLKSENKIKDFAVNFSAPFIQNSKAAEIVRLAEKNNINVHFPVCYRPFNAVEIDMYGNVYNCCSAFCRHNAIGNIFENNLTEIWRGKKAEEYRKKVLNGDYSNCDLDICTQFKQLKQPVSENMLPRLVNFSYDKECNLRCITCRDKMMVNSNEKLELLNTKVFDKLMPFLENAEIISISGAGEAFFSKHSRELIKRIASENKKVKWHIYTNGVYFNTKNCMELGIYNRIHRVTISLPALDRTIYDKIMRGSNYDTVMQNIKEAVFECRHNKAINTLNLNSVIHILNYKEMPKLAEFAKENDIYLSISAYRYWNMDFGREDNNVFVWNKESSEYENFIKVLKHPALDYERITMTPLFKRLREME